MASEIASSSATQTEPKRPLMPNNLLKAAIEGNEAGLKQLLGLNNEQPPPHTNVVVEDGAPTELSESDLLRSVAGMENTILHILSAYGHGNLVSTICMKDNSLLKASNVRNETPFHHAARFGHIKTISELIHCAKSAFGEDGLKKLLRQKNCLSETALHEAAKHDHGAVVSTLMEADLELAGMVNDDFVSPLYLATARGSLDMVQNMVARMLNHEITPDFYSGPKQQTALHAAVLQDAELTEKLLQLYSEPLGKWADETGRNPFHFVASTGNHKIAKLLLDKDPSLAYIQDSDRSFPVHTAAQMGHVEMMVLLLQRCHDSGDLLDGNGRNFLHIAIEAKKLNIICHTNRIFHIMFNRWVNTMDNLEDRVPISQWKKMFNRMVNTMDNKGNTPLHLAAEHGYNNFMYSLSKNMDSLLENNKLDLILQNKEGLTAFDISLIQLRKSATNTKSRHISGEFYVRKRGGRLSPGWFQHYTKDQMSEMELIRGTNQDHISTAVARDAKKSSEILMAKAQLVGLGSVLIATVTFAAAFTLPGGTNQDTGTPILGRKYLFKAFVLADFFAFVISFASTMLLIYSSSTDNSNTLETIVTLSISVFAFAARCMGIALGLCLYLVLAPIGNTGAVVLSISLLLTLYIWNPFSVFQQYQGFLLETNILKHIPDVASSRNHKKIRATKEYSYFNYRLCVPVLGPFIVIFLFALI